MAMCSEHKVALNLLLLRMLSNLDVMLYSKVMRDGIANLPNLAGLFVYILTSAATPESR